MSKEITIIQKELAPIIDKALSIEIKLEKDMPEAVEILSRLNQMNDRITSEKERITKPLLEALAVERGRWKPMETSNKLGIEHIRTEMSNYQTEQYKRQKEEEAKIAKKLIDGKIDVEKASKQFDKIKSVEKEVATEAGLVQFRETQVLKVWDHTMIPREYMLPDEKAILTALKAGKKVEGCELETVMVPVNYR